MLAEAQFVTIAPGDVGITTLQGGPFSGTSDVSSMFTLADGSTALAPNSITFAWTDTFTSSTGAAWNVGDRFASNTSVLSFSINTSILQSDGTKIVSGDSQVRHGAILGVGLSDGFEDLLGTGYRFTGASTYDATNPSTDIYQITNNGTGAQASIAWLSNDVTSSSVRGFTTSSAGNNNFFVGFGNLNFVSVPEPSSTALIGLSSLVVLLRRRR